MMRAGRARAAALAASWSPLLRRTLLEVAGDRCPGLAAQLAFYFMLALFPALLVVVAVIGVLPATGSMQRVFVMFAAIAPEQLIRLVRSQYAAISEGGGASLVTIGIVGALWSSSAAFAATIDALNQAYDVREWRPWWKRRALALALTGALTVAIACVALFVFIGPDVAQWIAAWFGIRPWVATAWSLARWPLLLGATVFALDFIYYIAPNRTVRWRWITPGAVAATCLWILSSFGFKFYVTRFGHYAATYGAIGGAIVTMLWFYVSSFAILIGAELNGVLEHGAATAVEPQRRQAVRA